MMNNLKNKFSFRTLGLGGVLAAGLLLAGYSPAKAQETPPPPPDTPNAAQGARIASPKDAPRPRPRRRAGDEPRPPAPNETIERPGEPVPPPDAPNERLGAAPPPPSAMGERPGAMPPPSMNPAMEQGLRDGLRQGELDRTSGKNFRPQKARDYKKATNGFQSANGNKQFYKDNYRQGFLRGYDRSFGGEARGGMNAPPAPPAGERPRPERENARRPLPPAPQNAPPATPVNN